MKPLEAFTELPAHLLTPFAQVERRGKPRLSRSFNATVYGTDAQGASFRFDTVLSNISASGLYFWSPGHVEIGAPLVVVSRLENGADGDAATPLVMLRGLVVRVVHRRSLRGVALKLTRHEFL